VTYYIARWFTRQQTVTHPSTNQAQCQLIKANALTTTPRRHRHVTCVAVAVNLVEFCCSWSYGILLWELFTVGKWPLIVSIHKYIYCLLPAVTLKNLKNYC